MYIRDSDTISTYKQLDLIEPLDLKLMPNYDEKSQDPRFLGPGTIDGTVYAVPKDWGTTGFIVNTKEVSQNPASWKEFFELAVADAGTEASDVALARADFEADVAGATT